MVTSVCWASMGRPVVAVDENESQVSSLREGRVPLHEPGLAELLERSSVKPEFTTDFARLNACRLVCIALDTSHVSDELSSIRGLERAIELVVPHLSDGTTLVVMSQIPVGFTRRLTKDIRSRRPELAFELCHWVETLVIGDAVERCLHPDRIILGTASGQSVESPALQEVISSFPCPVLWMSYESAELTKQAINLFLSASVTVANTLADLCEASGADMRQVEHALRLDRRIGKYAYLRPGLGFAGGNLERDLFRLANLGRRSQVDVSFLEAVFQHNSGRYTWVHRNLARHVYRFEGMPQIGVWGLAYKKNTQSITNSFSIKILKDLVGKGVLRVYDPAVSLPSDLTEKAIQCGRWEAVNGSDCLLVLTDWDEFKQTDFHRLSQRMRGVRVILDCVGVLDGNSASAQGLRYVAVGSPN
jgi:UDPglucose 6-dehydrogenase